MTITTEISLDSLASVTGGASLGNTLRAGAVAGMGLVTGEQAPSFPSFSSSGQTNSTAGVAGRAPFSPLSLPGGGMATFGK